MLDVVADRPEVGGEIDRRARRRMDPNQPHMLGDGELFKAIFARVEVWEGVSLRD